MKYRRFLRDNKKRVIYKKTEVFQRLLKMVLFFSKKILLKLVLYSFFIKKLKIGFFSNQIKNFCVLSGRSRGVLRKFNISRINFKLLVVTGVFFGLKKESW